MATVSENIPTERALLILQEMLFGYSHNLSYKNAIISLSYGRVKSMLLSETKASDSTVQRALSVLFVGPEGEAHRHMASMSSFLPGAVKYSKYCVLSAPHTHTHSLSLLQGVHLMIASHQPVWAVWEMKKQHLVDLGFYSSTLRRAE